MKGNGKTALFWALALAGVLMALEITGCGMKRDYAINKMLSYMRGKYGEEFTYVETYGGQYGSSSLTILVSSRENFERTAMVRFSEWEGRRRYEDNYLAHLRKEELEEKVGKLAQECFGECKVYYKLPDFVFPAWFKADMGGEEFLKSPYAMAQFYIYPAGTEGTKKEWEDRMEHFREDNAGKGYQIRGTLSLPETAGDYEMISENTFLSSDYQGYQAKEEMVFSMNRDGSFRYMRWLE